MTPEKQRVAIAEACGLRNIGLRPRRLTGYYCDDLCARNALGEWTVPIPDYLNSRDLMAGAERALKGYDRWRYGKMLASQGDSDASGYFRAATATAAQRAEAFLRTIGKWEETQKT